MNSDFLDEFISRATLSPAVIARTFQQNTTTFEDFLAKTEKAEIYYYLYSFPDHLFLRIKQKRLQKQEVLEFVDSVKRQIVSLSEENHQKLRSRVLEC